MNLSFTVNGRKAELEVPSDRRLLDVLREDLGLTGIKEGCGRGSCGACLVLLDNNLVNACLVPAFRVEGCEVLTVEGLVETREFADIEKAFGSTQVSQCGYCMPGIVTATMGLLREVPEPTDADIRRALAGNLCRCTGYQAIVETVQQVVEIRSRRKNARRP